MRESRVVDMKNSLQNGGEDADGETKSNEPSETHPNSTQQGHGGAGGELGI